MASNSDRRRWLGLGTRARTFMKLAELDQALIDGADPRESRELALRARQLAKPRKRIRFARTIENVVADVGSRAPKILFGVHRRRPVLKNRDLLCELADRLRASAPVSVRGLAMVDLLLYYRDGPVYKTESAVELERQVTAALAALEPGAELVPEAADRAAPQCRHPVRSAA